MKATDVSGFVFILHPRGWNFVWLGPSARLTLCQPITAVKNLSSTGYKVKEERRSGIRCNRNQREMRVDGCWRAVEHGGEGCRVQNGPAYLVDRFELPAGRADNIGIATGGIAK